MQMKEYIFSNLQVFVITLCFSPRYNLDANSQVSDERLWQALEEVQMREVVEALPERLG